MNSLVFLVPGNMELPSPGNNVCRPMVIAICIAWKTWRDQPPAVSLVFRNQMVAQASELLLEHWLVFCW